MKKRRFYPDLYVKTVYDIDLNSLKEMGIKAFIFDIDNTLVTYDDPVPTEIVMDYFKKLDDMGFMVYLVSNNNLERVKPFAEYAGLPYFAKALKPRKKYLKIALSDMGVKAEETALVGDQLFTDVWAGTRMNMYAILVDPISDKEDSFVHFKRKIEKWIFNRYNSNV